MINKSFLFFLVCLSLAIDSPAQNVGIGVPVPTEKLDVNGNINVQGNIKVNGVVGQAGQALTTNSAGVMVWGNLGEYKNIRTYLTSGTLVIPAGVTTLFVEIWGAGGGGATGGGGGSGGYIAGYMSVDGATSATIYAGVGGSSAGSAAGSANNGQASTVTLNAVTLTAPGGFGAVVSFPGDGGGFSTGANALMYAGEAGIGTTETYFQRTSTQYVTGVQFGRGGNAPFTSGTGGKGAYRSFDTNVPATQIKLYESSDAAVPGGGGGGGNFGSQFGSNGARGMVIIRWQ